MSETLYWREPLWLLLGLAPVLLWLGKQSAHSLENKLQNFADKHLLPYIIHQHQNSRRYLILFTCAWALACIALAGPFLVLPEAQSKQRQAVDIALVVDISPSMAAEDMKPNRLQRAQWELKNLIEKHAQDRFSLITFSSNAYTTLPLSFDKHAVMHFLASLDTQLPQRKGSNLSRALELAQKSLNNSHRDSRAIVLVTDGEAHSSNMLALAKQLAEQNMPLLILGVGTTAGAPVKDSAGRFIYNDNQPITSKLHRNELQQLAQASHGLYTELNANDNAIDHISERLQQIPSLNNYQLDSRFTQQLFPWFLMASLTLFSLVFIRRAPALGAALLLSFSLPNPEALADTNSDALNALKHGHYQQAQQLFQQLDRYRSELGLGAVAYRQQQWQRASTHYENALNSAADDEQRAQAAYNLGNSYAQQNRLEAAFKAYSSALNWQTNYSRARHNLNLVNQALHAQGTQTQAQGGAPHLEQNKNHNNDSINRDAQDTADTDLGNTDNSDHTATPKNNDSKLNGDVERNNRSAPQGANLANIQEDTRTLLEKRFARQDRTDQLNRIEDKPW